MRSTGVRTGCHSLKGKRAPALLWLHLVPGLLAVAVCGPLPIPAPGGGIFSFLKRTEITALQINTRFDHRSQMGEIIFELDPSKTSSRLHPAFLLKPENLERGRLPRDKLLLTGGGTTRPLATWSCLYLFKARGPVPSPD